MTTAASSFVLAALRALQLAPATPEARWQSSSRRPSGVGKEQQMPRKQPGVFKYTTKAGRVRWGYVIDVHADYDTGSRGQRRRRGFDTQAEASAELKRAKKAIVTGSDYFDAERLTFLGYLHTWLENLPATGIKERTISDYRNETRRYIEPHMKDVALQKLSPLHLEELYRKLTKGEGRTANHSGPTQCCEFTE